MSKSCSLSILGYKLAPMAGEDEGAGEQQALKFPGADRTHHDWFERII